jgi:hypothetical protein
MLSWPVDRVQAATSQVSAWRGRASKAGRSPNPFVERLLWLQRQAGNQAVASLLSLQRNAKFDTATTLQDKVGEPESMELPRELTDGMQAAWDASFPHGKSQEQGGILVKTKDGKYEWRAGKAGNSGSFTPNTGDLKAGETLIAIGHTHPYDESEGGTTGVGFSGGDLATMIYYNNPIEIVQSGRKTFVVTRTKEFQALADKADTRAKKKALEDQINATWDGAFAKAQSDGQDFVEAVRTAVGAVCDKYQLVWYEGEAGKMERKAKAHVQVVGGARGK